MVNHEQTVSFAEMERMMKVQEVILKAMAGSLKWWEAAEIIGVSDRTMRRWRERYQEGGYDGLYDRRKRRPYYVKNSGILINFGITIAIAPGFGESCPSTP